MELQDIIRTAIGASIPLFIFYFGYLIKRLQDKKEGKHRSRIQFELEAKFFGPQKGYYIAEIIMVLNNEGLVRNKINELLLSIRGIEQDTKIGLFKNEDYPESIADFPKELVKNNVLKKKGEENEKKKDDKKENIQKKGKEWFVEPRVVQRFTYVARIPEDIRFILVRSSFKYHEKAEHSAQKVFELRACENEERNNHQK